jgi:hypothetical protein
MSNVRHLIPLAPTTYLWASVAVGTAQVADAVALVKFKGRLGAITTVFSVGEYVWAVVSFFVWRAAEESIPYWLPASFIAYVAAFFAAGLVLVAQNRGPEVPIPNHLVVAGGVFGVYFAVTSAIYATGA